MLKKYLEGLSMLKNVLFYVSLLLVLFMSGCVPDNFKFEKEIIKAGSDVGSILSASDMDTNSEGNLVLADAGNNRVQTITTSGSVVMQSSGGAKASNRFQSISGLGVSPSTDEIYVCDQRGNKILVLSSSGNFIMKITSKVKCPMDVAVDKNGESYAIMARTPEIYKYSPDGKFISLIGGVGKAALTFPISIRLHKDFIYVADFGSRRIVQLDKQGNFVAEYKKKGEYEVMKGPSAIHFDSSDNMYILDLGEVPVVILRPNGELISKIGGFGSEPGKFLFPTGIVAKSEDEIYILDNSRNTILNFTKKPQ